jgi:hypothetical protein
MNHSFETGPGLGASAATAIAIGRAIAQAATSIAHQRVVLFFVIAILPLRPQRVRPRAWTSPGTPAGAATPYAVGGVESTCSNGRMPSTAPVPPGQQSVRTLASPERRTGFAAGMRREAGLFRCGYSKLSAKISSPTTRLR